MIVKASEIIEKPVLKAAKLIQPMKERKRMQVRDDLRALNC